MNHSLFFAATLSLLGLVACGQTADTAAKQSLSPNLDQPESQCESPVCPPGTHSTKPNPGTNPVPKGTDPSGDHCATLLYCAPDEPVGCEGIAACAQGELQVAEGFDGAHAVEHCGAKVWCIEDGGNECTAMPSCPEDEIQVDQGSDDARAVQYCGTTIYCAPNGQFVCQSIAACAPGELEVQPGTPGSHDVEWCGTTVTCSSETEPKPGTDGGAGPDAPAAP